MRRQKFLEMVDKNESSLSYVKALKDLEGLWTKEEFNSLWYCLTISKLNDHPNYEKWTPQNGRFSAFENAKIHLCSVFSFVEDNKIEIGSNLEELLQYSYGMLQKKKASEIIQKELGHNIVPMIKPSPINLSQYESFKNRGNNMNIINHESADVSSSMMWLGLEEQDQMLMMEDPNNPQRRNSFKDNNFVQNYNYLTHQVNQIDKRDQISVHRDNSVL